MELVYQNDAGADVTLAGAGSESDTPFALTAAQGLYGLSSSIRLSDTGGETVWVSTRIQPRSIRIEGAILADVATNRLKLLACLSPLTPGWLTLKREDTFEHIRRIRCHIQEAPAFSQSDGTRFHAVLIAPSLYWEDGDGDTTAMVSGWTGGIEFPYEIVNTFEFGWRAPGTSVNVHNFGDVHTGLVFKMLAFGPVVNPELLQTDTSERIRLIAVFRPGDELTVSTVTNAKRATITRADGSTENGMPMLDPQSSFISLRPGDNLLRVSADSGEEAMESAVSFRARYLGV